jgi:hypothetical protein
VSTAPAGAITASRFPEQAVRERARRGAAALFPSPDQYGSALFGASDPAADRDALDELRLVPPVFMPERLEKLIDLGREPLYTDVDLDTDVGGFHAPLPVYVSAFGSTQVANGDLAVAASRQAGQLGLPMVIGENIVPMHGGYGRIDREAESILLRRLRAYLGAVPDGMGGVVVQQSTEDADAEVWNLVYSDPAAGALLDSGRLGFELKVGQGAKPGLGGMTMLPATAPAAARYHLQPLGTGGGSMLRNGSPGTLTDEILRQQVRMMRNNYPRARTWVKLHPARDIAEAASVAWTAGADAVSADGAEAGTGWAPTAFLDHVGLPLAECLRRIAPRGRCLLGSGRLWEGTRLVKGLALGARAMGLGRAALIAVDEDRDGGLRRLVECLAMETRMLVSALGHYTSGAVLPEDVWSAGGDVTVAGPATDRTTTSTRVG